MPIFAMNGPKNLMALDLQDNQLDAAAMYQLAQGNWPNLSALKLSDNHLNDDAIGYLSTGAWPRLCSNGFWELRQFRRLTTLSYC